MRKVIKDVFTGFSFLLLVSCQNSTGKRPTSLKLNSLESNGVNIAFEDSKIGNTTLLFIHGWGIDKTYWTNQVDFFSKKYRVVTIDLPGFGKSGKNRNDWTIGNYCNDVLTVINKLNLKNVVLIGHSMSGSVIVETAIKHPSLILGIIGIDNLKNTGVVVTPQMEKEWSKWYCKARMNFKREVSESIQDWFSPSTDSTIRQRVTNDITNSDPAIAIDVLKNSDKYPFPEKIKSFEKTIYLINSNHEPTDTLALQRNNVKYCLLNIGKTGHYPMLEKVTEFNVLLQQAIDKITN